MAGNSILLAALSVLSACQQSKHSGVCVCVFACVTGRGEGSGFVSVLVCGCVCVLQGGGRVWGL